MRRLTIDRVTGELIEDIPLEPFRMSEESTHAKIVGGPRDIITTLVYKASPTADDPPLKYPLPMTLRQFKSGMQLCLVAHPYSMVDVEVLNRASADTLLALRDEMAEIARAAWAEDITCAVSTVHPLPPVPGRGETRRLLKEAQRADPELQLIIAATKQELDPSYSRRTAKSAARAKVYVVGRDLPTAEMQESPDALPAGPEAGEGG